MGAMVFGEHEPGGVHVRAGDMRMDVDAACHRNQSACVKCFVRLRAGLRRRDDPIVAHPEIADFVMAIGRIDDMRVSDMGQHGGACVPARQAPMR